MLTRDDKIEASVLKYVYDRLPDYQYEPSGEDQNVIVRDAFPTPDEREQELKTTVLALGFTFDDGGVALELGSDLHRFIHTIEFWTFATAPEIGKNLAAVVRHILLNEQTIPILDVGVSGQPEIGYLWIESAPRARQIAQQPRPWDENVWTVTAKAQDDHPLSEL